MNRKLISILLSLVMVLSIFVPNILADNTGIYMDPIPYYDDVMEDINGPTHLPIDTLEGTGNYDEERVEEENTGIVTELEQNKREENVEFEKIINESSDLEIKNKVAADSIKATDKVTFIVEMEKASLMDRGFDKAQISAQTASVASYQRKQEYDIAALETNLQRAFGNQPDFKIGFNYKVALTGLSVTTQYGNKKRIESMPGVKKVFVAPVYSLPTPVDYNKDLSLKPSTHNAVGMIGADKMNTNGYTGKGMRIAILDTGMLLDHPNFNPLPEDKLENPLTREEIEKVWDQLNASKTTLLKNAYYNTKIPYRFNYSTLDYNVDHSYAGHDHGTHVAGIAAANKIDDVDVIGVAPDAQLIIMQVFSRGGGADFAQILAALEDCIHLDVDAANLSLGSANGFTDDSDESNTNKVLNKFKNTGIEVLIASGNDTNNALGNNTGLNMSPIGNPDIGLAGTPSTYKAALGVASIDNDFREALYFTVNGREIAFEDSGDNNEIKFIMNFANQTLDFVVVPGYGKDSDYEGIDVEGKVALVLRGNASFTEKQNAAKEHGAIACIVRNNEPGPIRMFINQKDSIPCIGIFQEDGKYMAEMKSGQLTVCQEGDTKTFKMNKAVSSFSSWGVTPDLKLKPEIAGVGGQVKSTTDPQISGSKYAVWDGTSMATPQVCGASVLVKQYFEKNHPEIKGDALRRIVANTMMSTATIIKDEGLESSPRAQGSGLVNVVNATSTNGYLTSRDATEQRPKGEMGDDPTKTGKFSFNFEINNMSKDKPLTYDLSASVNTETIHQDKYIANKPYALNSNVKFYKNVENATSGFKFDFNKDGKVDTADARLLWIYINGKGASSVESLDNADVNGDGEIDVNDVKTMLTFFAELPTDVDVMEKISSNKELVNQIEVPANSKVELTAEIQLTEADKQYVNRFPNGIFIEGFVYANSKDDISLNMPYVGFYGDWSKPPIFDEPNMKDAALWGIQLFTTANTLIGTNPYFIEGTGGDEYNAISYSTPPAALLFGQLRGAKKLELTVTNKETGEKYFSIDGKNMPKSMFVPRYGQVVPTIIENGKDGSKNIWDGLDNEGKELPSGTKVLYNLIGYVDDGDMIADDQRSIELTIDSVFPEIKNRDMLQESLRFENDRTYLKLNMWDDQHIAAVLFLAPNGKVMGKYEVNNTPGVEIENEYDISGFGNEFTIVVADYAMNQTEVDATLDLKEHNNDVPKPIGLSKDRLYGCETFDRAVIEAGWFSAKKDDFTGYRNETFDPSNRYYSGEYVNGYIVGMSAITGNIDLITPGGTYWPTLTLIEQNGKVGDNGFNVFYDMALKYGTKTVEKQYADSELYAVGWAYKGDNNNDSKDDGYNALFKVVFYENGYNEIQEVGKIAGVEGEILTLGITTEGKAYGINSTGRLFSINLEPDNEKNIKCTEIGETDFVNEFNYSGINVIQSMGYDHNTGTMYWYAHSQTPVNNKYVNVNKTYKVDLTNAKCTEVGSYGQGGPTTLFVPNDFKCDLFTMGVKPTDVIISPNKMIMVEGQKVKLKTQWKPWNAQPTKVTWSSDNDELATVDEYGFVTAHKEGNVKISATADIKDYPGNIVPKTGTCEIEIVPSEDGLYSFVVQDQRVKAPYLKWVTFSDKDPRDVTELPQQKIPAKDQDGKDIEIAPLWQGGAYYNGYLYSVVKDIFNENNMISQGMSLYKYRVYPGQTPKDLTFGQPEKVGFVEGAELVNLAFDYTTSRLYAVDAKRGGLGLLDMETGDYDYLGDFSGDIGGPAIATAMTITRDGTIIIADMKGKLYTVDPDTMNTTEIYNENTDYWYYGSMTYDYNTDSIYWNPCMGPNASPFKIVRLGEDEWTPGKLKANVMEMPAIMSKVGTQTTVMFAIPENEPEATVIPVKDIKITNGPSIQGITGGTFQLETQTEPLRPTLRTRTWTSDNTESVEVDKYGVLTFKKPGKARVTVSITNRDPLKDGGPFTDTVEVEVFAASGAMDAFLANDIGGSQYYNFWLHMNDYDLGHAEVKESTISIYALRTGVYYDNYYYAYNNDQNLLRIDKNDKKLYKVIGKVRDDSGMQPVVTGMAIDYKTGTCYAVTQDGSFGTIDLNNAKYTEIKKLDSAVFAISVDKRGTLYGVASPDYYSKSKLYTINKEDGTMEVVRDMPFVAYSGNEGYGDLRYNPQMTYDYSNDRLYVNATSHIRDITEVSAYDGMYIINLSDNGIVGDPINIGGVMLQLRGEPKKGHAFLGLMAFTDNEIPEENDKVDGIFMNKEFGRVAIGEEVQLKATLRPSYVQENEINWTSSDEGIATVENGIVTGIEPGIATITATSASDPTKTTSCEITVIERKEKIAYSAILDKDGIFKYNIELPGNEPQKIGTADGKISGMVMIDNTLYFVKMQGSTNYLYSYDLTTNVSRPVAPLTAYFELEGLAYDKKNDLLYGIGGFYIFQYQFDKVRNAGGETVPNSAAFMDPDYGTLTSIAVDQDGTIFYTSNSYANVAASRLKTTNMYFETPELIKELNIKMAAGRCEMAYDEATNRFYITDLTDNIYYMDKEGNLEPIDCVGDNLSITGIALE